MNIFFRCLQAHKHNITKVSTYNYGKLNAAYDMYAYMYMLIWHKRNMQELTPKTISGGEREREKL